VSAMVLDAAATPLSAIVEYSGRIEGLLLPAIGTPDAPGTSLPVLPTQYQIMGQWIIQ